MCLFSFFIRSNLQKCPRPNTLAHLWKRLSFGFPCNLQDLYDISLLISTICSINIQRWHVLKMKGSLPGEIWSYPWFLQWQSREKHPKAKLPLNIPVPWILYYLYLDLFLCLFFKDWIYHVKSPPNYTIWDDTVFFGTCFQHFVPLRWSMPCPFWRGLWLWRFLGWTAPGEVGGEKPTLKTNMMLGKKTIFNRKYISSFHGGFSSQSSCSLVFLGAGVLFGVLFLWGRLWFCD